MQKKILKILIIILTMSQTIVNNYASVIREITLENQDTIPFNITTSNQKSTIQIPISDYQNPKISNINLTNGQVLDSWIDENKINLKVTDVEYSNIPRKIILTDKTTLKNIEPQNGQIVIKKSLLKGDITEVIKTTGDFENENIQITEQDIIININENKGTLVNSDQYETKKIKFAVSEKNTEQNFTTEPQILPNNADLKSVRIADNLKNGTAQINLNGRDISITFSDGKPIKNQKESTILNHGYQWIDRFINGHFENYYPNQKYWTPKMKFQNAKGEYVYDDTKYSVTKSELDWDKYDYWEYEINGLRYDEKTGTTQFIVNENIKNTFNTEKFFVKIDSENILVNPYGHLTSIEGKNGTEFPKHDTESNETFYNSNTGKYEYYVRHLLFYYGPKINLFAGNYTYPYEGGIEIEYKENIQKRVYEGSIIYNYEKQENSIGYNYNGTVDITYGKTRTIEDLPPTKPKSITIDKTGITHSPSTDDYTPQNKLRYIYYCFKNNEWIQIGTNQNGKTTYNWQPQNIGLTFQNLKIGVSAHDLYQEGPMGEYIATNDIELTAILKHNEIIAGETQEIFAVTEANPEINEVTYELNYNSIQGNMTQYDKQYPQTWVYHINGTYIKNLEWNVIGLLKYPNDIEYGIVKDQISKALPNRTPQKACEIDNSTINEFIFFANDENNLSKSELNLGTEFTIILPPLKQNGIVTTKGYKAIEIYTNIYDKIIRFIETKNKEKVYETPTKYTWQYINRYYIDILCPSYWESTGEIQRVEVPSKDIPVAIVCKDNKATIYQNGELIQEINLKGLLTDDFSINYLKYGSVATKYILDNGGKYVFSKKAWTKEQIEKFIDGPYQNTKWYVEDGFNYNIPSYTYGLPTIEKWQAKIKLPIDIPNGEYEIKLTATNGLTKTIQLPFKVKTPIEPIGDMPTQMYIGNTYEIYATSSKYTNKMELYILGQKYQMTFLELNSQNRKVWKHTITIPQTSKRGENEAEFKAYLPSGNNEATVEKFNLAINAFIIGENATGKRGETVELSAQTYGYCKQTNVTIEGQTYNMFPQKSTNNYDNTWTAKYTIPHDAPIRAYSVLYETTNDDIISNEIKKLIVIDDLPKIKQITIGRLIKNETQNQIINLIPCTTSDIADSIGLICAGHVLAVEIETEEVVDKVEIDILGDKSIKQIDHLTYQFEQKELEQYNTFPLEIKKEEGKYTFCYTIPYKTKQTLHSWTTLRNENNNGFNINTNKLLERIKEPYIINIKIFKEDTIIEENIKIDVFERWDKVLNRDISNYT